MWGLIPSGRRCNELSKCGDTWDMKSVLDSFFNEPLIPTFFGSYAPFKVDIRETEKEYFIDAELPGVKKEDIRIELKDEVLTVSVEHNEETREEGHNFIRKERKYGARSRSFQVGGIRHEDVEARYDNGILTIKLPRQKEVKDETKRININ